MGYRLVRSDYCLQTTRGSVYAVSVDTQHIFMIRKATNNNKQTYMKKKRKKADDSLHYQCKHHPRKKSKGLSVSVSVSLSLSLSLSVSLSVYLFVCLSIFLSSSHASALSLLILQNHNYLKKFLFQKYLLRRSALKNKP